MPRIPIHAVVGGVKIAGIKQSHDPNYGGLPNTNSGYPIRQTITVNGQPQTFKWDSAERAFHAQKLIHLLGKRLHMHAEILAGLRTLEKYPKKNGREFLPRDDWDPFVNRFIREHGSNFGKDKAAFDTLCDANYHPKAPRNGLKPNGEPYTNDFMREIIKLKVAQHPKLANLLKVMAREGIFPVEYSNYDMNWASGPNGDGQNRLGILLLEEGNQLLHAEGGRPAIPDPASYYAKELRGKHPQSLTHNALDQCVRSPKDSVETSSTAARRGYAIGRVAASSASSTGALSVYQPTGQRRSNLTIIKDNAEPWLELHMNNRTGSMSAIYQNKGSTKWNTAKDLSRPNVQRLLGRYQQQLEKSAKGLKVDAYPDGETLLIRRNADSETALHLTKKTGEMRMMYKNGKEGAWQWGSNMERPNVQRLLGDYQKAAKDTSPSYAAASSDKGKGPAANEKSNFFTVFKR